MMEKFLKKIGKAIERIFVKITSTKFLFTVSAISLAQYNLMKGYISEKYWVIVITGSVIFYFAVNTAQKITLKEIFGKLEGKL